MPGASGGTRRGVVLAALVETRRRGQHLVAALALFLSVAPVLAGELRGFGLGSFEEIRRVNAGRPHIVAFWSTTCPACLEEMPVWRDLLRGRPDVALSLVSADGPPDAAAVRQRLAEFGLGEQPTWIFADERVEKLRYSIDRSWRGELPRTYLFDAQGRAEVVTGRVEARWLKDWLARRAPR